MFTHPYRSTLYLGLLTCLVSACAGSSGSASNDHARTISAGERIVADTSKVLSAASVRAVYGFYNASCTDPGLGGWTAGSATQPSWSIVATEGSTLPDGAPPAVLLLEGDSANCNLVLTDIILADATDLVIAGGAGMVLNNDGTYQATASELQNASSTVAYINGTTNQTGAPFAANFNLNLDISDSLGTASASGSGNVTITTTGFASINGVPAPDYTASVTIGDLLTDSSGLVTDAHGSVGLAFTSQEGLSSEIVTGDLSGDTFAQVDTAFKAGTPVPFVTTGWSGTNGECGGAFTACPTFDISNFITTGTTNLTTALVDSLIVRYVDPNGVATYETIKLTFSAH